MMEEEQKVESGEQEERELTAKEKIELERQEEAKLRQKFPMAGRPGLPGKPAGGPGGQSSFLQKRMAKNTKYFDSGDYQMDLQKGKGRPGLPGLKLGAAPAQGQAGQSLGPTGQVIPTPELVPVRKTSIIQPRADHSQPHSLLSGGESPHSPGLSPTGAGATFSPGHSASSSHLSL